jgi:hypothetical protein
MWGAFGLLMIDPFAIQCIRGPFGARWQPDWALKPSRFSLFDCHRLIFIRNEA